jgi:acetoacetyl-CoA synthetase
MAQTLTWAEAPVAAMTGDAALPAGSAVVEGELLWTPPEATVEGAAVERFRHWVNARLGLDLADYDALHAWSVQELEAFWSAVWDYFDIQSQTPYTRVLDRRRMPGTRWFADARVNYAEHLLRHETRRPDDVAIHHASELRPLATMTWRELGARVRALAQTLRRLGIRPGDHVAAYLPNIPETAIAMMATTAIGAVWSAASPEFGPRAVIDRFAQVKPRLVFVVDGYRFGGEDFPRGEAITQILAGLECIEHVVWVPYLQPEAPPELSAALRWDSLFAEPAPAADDFRYERVAYDEPLWVLFSSGTSGPPKAIVHSHVGVLVEHYKLTAFHVGITPESRVFYHSTTGWMMWNVLVASLLQGSAIVMYDGSPIGPDPAVLWRVAEQARITHLGVSPTFVQIMQKHDVRPGERFDLSALEMVLLAGSPSMPETFAWLYDTVKRDLWVTSQSGGTEIVSAFVAATPTKPVYAGEIQARALGMDVHVRNEHGEPQIDQVGELVLTAPFPSMPLRFCNDPDDRRYRESYFEAFDRPDGVWRHGDHMRLNARGGCYIYGRSDSLLNRYGVCIGTAEIYRSVERMDEVLDSIIVCCELAGGRFFMPMFVRLRSGVELDEVLRDRISRRLRADCSPRHVPDQIYKVEQIPYTLTGKKMEVPVRRLLAGWPLELTASRDAMLNPEAIDWFVRFRAENYEMLTG